VSAFVVSNKTINNIVNRLAEEVRDSKLTWWTTNIQKHVKHPVTADSDDWKTELGELLIAMNIEAVSQRYPDVRGNFTKGEVQYWFTPKDVNRFQALKDLSCYIYQCTEGDVPNRALYKTIKEFEYELAMRIIEEMPRYKAAIWGS
jgi:hypothetical protein